MPNCFTEGVGTLEFAFPNELVVSNTWFKKKPKHLVTYQSGVAATQIDFILYRRSFRIQVSNVKVILGEECASQHRLLVPNQLEKEVQEQFVQNEAQEGAHKGRNKVENQAQGTANTGKTNRGQSNAQREQNTGETSVQSKKAQRKANSRENGKAIKSGENKMKHGEQITCQLQARMMFIKHYAPNRCLCIKVAKSTMCN